MKKFQNHERGKKQRQTMLKNTHFIPSFPIASYIAMLLCGQKANFSSSLHFDFSISLMSGIGKSENVWPREKFVLISSRIISQLPCVMICSIFFFSFSRYWFSTRKLFFCCQKAKHHLVIIFSCWTSWCTSISDQKWCFTHSLCLYAKSITKSF